MSTHEKIAGAAWEFLRGRGVKDERIGIENCPQVSESEQSAWWEGKVYDLIDLMVELVDDAVADSKEKQ